MSGLAGSVEDRDETILMTVCGMLLISADGGSVRSIRFMGEAGTICSYRSARSPVLIEASRQITEYFAGCRDHFDLPLQVTGSTFQKLVLGVVASIPLGRVVTYGEIATRIGRPGAARAVGRALRNNPLPIVIPCHRVVSASGLGGFTPDISVKQCLLRHEGLAL